MLGCPDPPRLATGLHAVPFQRSIRVRWCRLRQRLQPTAQALRADAAATPSSAAPAAVFGRCTRCQPLPFQCAMRAWPLPGSLPACPTAQAFRADVAATYRRAPRTANGDAGIAARLAAVTAWVVGARLIPASKPTATRTRAPSHGA